VELLDRMLTIDVKGRADMTEVILCLSAVYSGRPLPPRKERSKKEKEKEKDSKGSKSKSSKKKNDGAGTYRTDGQGIVQEESLELDPVEALAKTTEVKKLNPNSAAARRRKAAGGSAALHAPRGGDAETTDDFGISKMDNPFASAEISEAASSMFGSFEGGKSETGSDAIEGAFGADQNWSNLDPEAFGGPDDEDAAPPSKSSGGRERSRMKITAPRPRSRSTGSRHNSDSPKVATTHRRGHSGERGRSSRADDAEAAGDAAPEKRRHRTNSKGRGLVKKHATKNDKAAEGDDAKPRRSGNGSSRSRRETTDDPA
jgi:hypothetical protein